MNSIAFLEGYTMDKKAADLDTTVANVNNRASKLGIANIAKVEREVGIAPTTTASPVQGATQPKV